MKKKVGLALTALLLLGNNVNIFANNYSASFSNNRNNHYESYTEISSRARTSDADTVSENDNFVSYDEYVRQNRNTPDHGTSSLIGFNNTPNELQNQGNFENIEPRASENMNENSFETETDLEQNNSETHESFEIHEIEESPDENIERDFDLENNLDIYNVPTQNNSENKNSITPNANSINIQDKNNLYTAPNETFETHETNTLDDIELNTQNEFDESAENTENTTEETFSNTHEMETIEEETASDIEENVAAPSDLQNNSATPTEQQINIRDKNNLNISPTQFNEVSAPNQNLGSSGFDDIELNTQNEFDEIAEETFFNADEAGATSDFTDEIIIEDNAEENINISNEMNNANLSTPTGASGNFQDKNSLTPQNTTVAPKNQITEPNIFDDLIIPNENTDTFDEAQRISNSDNSVNSVNSDNEVSSTVFANVWFTEEEYYSDSVGLTKTQAVKSILKMTGLDNADSSNATLENYSAHPDAEFLKIADSYDIIDVTSENFNPDDLIKKYELILLLENLFEVNEIANSDYTVINDVSESDNEDAFYAINKYYEHGIIELDEQNNFAPLSYLSKDEFLNVLYNLQDVSVKNLNGYSLSESILIDRIFAAR